MAPGAQCSVRAGCPRGERDKAMTTTVSTWNGGNGNWSQSNWGTNGVPNSHFFDAVIGSGGNVSLNIVVLASMN